MEKEYTLFDNDYVAHCNACADDWRDFDGYDYDVFPGFPQETKEAESILTKLGMGKADMYRFLADAMDEPDNDKAYEKLGDKICELADAHKNGEVLAKDAICQLMLESDSFSEAFDEALHEDLRCFPCEAFGVEPEESFLVFGKDLGWQNRSGVALMKPEKDIATSLIQMENTDTKLKITYKEGESCFRAKAYTHDSPMGESFTIIPQSMAKDYFKHIDRSKLYGLFAVNAEIQNFLAETHAVPEMEQDPAAFGIMVGIMAYAADPHIKVEDNHCHHATKDEIIHEMAGILASTSMSDLNDYCWDEGNRSIGEAAKEWPPKDVAEHAWDMMYGYLAEEKPAPSKDTPLARGIEQVLRGSSIEKKQELIVGLIRGNAKAKKELKDMGRKYTAEAAR